MTDFAARRRIMVDSQIRPSDVTRYPIIEAMLHVPREAFVPPDRREAAYLGENLRLGPGRVMLEPRTFAKLLEALAIEPGERVLHVGAGLGYGAAVMARMGARVTALEDEPERAAAARRALGLHAPGVAVVTGSLAEGAPTAAPFDAILIEGAIQTLPAALEAQLVEDGRIAALFAENGLGVARIGRKEAGHVHWRDIFNAGAPVLPGFEAPRVFVF